MTWMAPLEFREPWLLAAMILAVPAYFLARSSPGRLRFSALALLPASSSSWRSRFAWIPSLLLALAIAALAIALAGPRIGDRSAPVVREGIAIMMVVDTSSSMRALDLSEDEDRDRLSVVKEVFTRFVLGGDGLAGRGNDTIGLISFARYADTRCPLTLDHHNLATVADHLEIVNRREEDGTALGDGLGLALERLRQSPAKSKIAILLTDGVSNAGSTQPLEAADLAQHLGIKVYAIGAGTHGIARVPVRHPLTGEMTTRAVPVEIDEATLQAIAKKTGAKYFRATDESSLQGVYQEIDQLERTRVEEKRFHQYHEYFDLLVGLGMLLLALGWALRDTIWRRLPL